MVGPRRAPLCIPEGFWGRDNVRDALHERDIGQLFRLLKRYAGASQTTIAIAVGLQQGYVSKMMSNAQRMTGFDSIERVANGLDMPNQVRIILGLAPRMERCPLDFPTLDQPDSAIVTRSASRGKSNRMAISVLDVSERIANELSMPDEARIQPGLAPTRYVAGSAKTLRGQVEHESSLATVQPSDEWDDGDPSLILHWEALLRMLSDHENLLGSASVYVVAQGEYNLVRERRKRISGEATPALMRIEARWAEFCSWTAENSGEYAKTTRWLEFALQLAERANAQPTAAYILMRQAQRAADRGDADQVLRLVSKTSDVPGLSKRDKALCAIREAQGHALRGDRQECTRVIGRAERLLTQAIEYDFDDSDTIGGHAGREYLAAYESYCHLLLGDVIQAVAGFETALERWPSRFRQDEALTRAWLGLAYLAAGRLSEAAAQGTHAISVADGRPAARAFRALGQLHQKIEPSDESAILAFHTAYGKALQPHNQET